MAYKRFQNTVAESKLLLPFSIAVTAAALYLSGIVDGGWWVQLMCLVVSTALLVELNNTNQLLRVVSQCTPATSLPTTMKAENSALRSSVTRRAVTLAALRRT